VLLFLSGDASALQAKTAKGCRDRFGEDFLAGGSGEEGGQPVGFRLVSLRVVLYSHDSYGLGHLRRSVTLGAHIAVQSPHNNILLVSGTPRPQAFSLPMGVDLVKIPSVTKDDEGEYRARSLQLPLDEVIALRSRIIEASVSSFTPDVMIVDHVPTGLGNELLPTFERLRNSPSRPRMILGLRDVIDDAARVRVAWDAHGVWETISAEYDDVLVYGDVTLTTTATELSLSERVRCQVRHVGYVVQDVPQRSVPRSDRPTVVVTVGGGGDGHRLLGSYGRFLSELGPRAWFRSVVVVGPLLSPQRRAEIEAVLVGSGAPVEILTFTRDHAALLANADAVVAMGGYNTTCEILAADVPALLVPRAKPRSEQLIRARRLADLSLVEMTTVDELAPARLLRFIEEATARSHSTAKVPIDLGGAAAVAALIGA
jgi:predicted glycosyltransferase